MFHYLCLPLNLGFIFFQDVNVPEKEKGKYMYAYFNLAKMVFIDTDLVFYTKFYT